MLNFYTLEIKFYFKQYIVLLIFLFFRLLIYVTFFLKYFRSNKHANISDPSGLGIYTTETALIEDVKSGTGGIQSIPRHAVYCDEDGDYADEFIIYEDGKVIRITPDENLKKKRSTNNKSNNKTDNNVSSVKKKKVAMSKY